MLVSIIAFIVTIAVLIVVHEAGHFFVAKWLGVRVIRFSVGYPPRIFGIRHGETDYAIGALPLGGYCRMLGNELGGEAEVAEFKLFLDEIRLDLLGAARAHAKVSGKSAVYPKGSDDHRMLALAGALSLHEAAADSSRAGLAVAREIPERSDAAISLIGRPLKQEEELLAHEIAQRGSVSDAIEALAERRPSALLEAYRQRAFPTQSLLKRTAIVLAGPAANLLFAPIMLTLIFMWGLPTLLPVVGQVEKGMPAYIAGLQTGDRVIAVDGHAIKTWDALSAGVKSSKGATVHLEIQRVAHGFNSRMDLAIVPKRVDEKAITGQKIPEWIIGVMPRGDHFVTRFGPLAAVGKGVYGTGMMFESLAVGVSQMINGTTPLRDALGGPIMIAQLAGAEAKRGLSDLALFVVMLSIELGIINLFPVPMLDGGHLLFFACEAVRRKPLELRHREIALQIGVALIAVLFMFLIINDIARILKG